MLTTAIIGALVSFGGYSSNLSNYPRFYGNNISINTYYDLNKYSVNDVYHFHDIIRYNVDFEEQGDDIIVFINEINVRTYLIGNSNNNSETLIRVSSQFYDDDGLSTRGIPLRYDDDTRFINVGYQGITVTGNTLSYQVRTFWNDDNLDSGVGVIEDCSFTASNTVYGLARFNTFNVDMNSLYNQVNRAFITQSGGYYDGYNKGYADGVSNDTTASYEQGYTDGYVDGVATNDTAFTIFNGILGIGMLPINVFLAMLDWEVFGINISNFVMSILTLAVTIYVISTFTGKKEGKK